MLAKLYALCLKKFNGQAATWQECLPSKYVSSATYSVVVDVDDKEIISQIEAGIKA